MRQAYITQYITNPQSNTTVKFIGTEEELQSVLNRGFRLSTDEEAKRKEAKYSQNKVFDPVFNEEGLPEVYFFCPSFKGDGYGMASYSYQKLVKKHCGIYLNKEYRGQKLGLCFYTPNGIKFVKTPKKIIFSMFETTKYPEFWGDYFKQADLVLNPSHWGCDVLKKQFGVNAEVLPLGYDDTVFKYTARAHKETFTFLHYDAFKKRKGWDLVFKAFTEEFNEDEPVKLIFKTTLGTNPPMHEYKNIEVIKGVYSQKQLQDLLTTCDCFVFPSRGEGFGLTPLEALATGMPAIIPSHSGFSIYADKRFMYVLNKFVPEVAKYDNTDLQDMDLGYFMRCDVAELKQAMRTAYNEWKTKTGLYADNGFSCSNYAKQFTATESSKKLGEILKKLM